MNTVSEKNPERLICHSGMDLTAIFNELDSLLLLCMKDAERCPGNPRMIWGKQMLDRRMSPLRCGEG